jgi:hypothetical protein
MVCHIGSLGNTRCGRKVGWRAGLRMQVLAPMTGLSLARVSNRRRGHRTQNRGCRIDAGSNPVVSTR